MTTTQPPSVSDQAVSRWSNRQVLIILLPLLLYYAFPIGFWPRQIGANSSAHAYLTMALYFRGETCVDEEVRDYNFNQDLIYKNGHYYSNKAPGPAMWLLPAAAAVDLASSGKLELVPLLYFGRLLMLTLVWMIFLFFLGRTLERFAAPAIAWGLTLALALGSSASAYATLYLSHDLAAMGLVTGFLILLRARPRWCWLGGLATGFAVVCEFQTVGIAILLALFSPFAGKGRFNWKAALSFGLGAVPMALLLLVYNRSLSGTVTELAYQTEFKQFELATGQTLGFLGPNLRKLCSMAFSPGVGLFFFSPWLLLAIPAGIAALRRRSPDRRLLIAAIAAPIVLVSTIASHEYWVGGAIAGPRYLTACLPFFLFPIAVFLNRLRGRWRTITTIGLLATVIVAVAIFACLLTISPLVNTAPEKLSLNPLTSFVFPLIARKTSALTVANLLGAGRGVSLALHVLLLVAALAGFVAAWLRSSTAHSRAIGLSGVIVGGLLFAGWTQLGASRDPFASHHVQRAARVMLLDDQPTWDGHIRFVRRLHVLAPPRRFQVLGRPFDDAHVEVISEELWAEELAFDFKSAFTAAACPDGSLLISDISNNTVHRYSPPGKLSLFLDEAGAEGAGVVFMLWPGVSGIALDRDGRVILTENGRRCVSRIEADGTRTVLADRFQGKRLNSPRGATMRSDGTLFFTDPPFGLHEGHPDGAQELEFSGVYSWRQGELRLLTTRLGGPSGLAFSPDEKHLYVTDWKPGNTAVARFDVDPAGNLSHHTVLCKIKEGPSLIPTVGLVVDRRGNLYVTADMRLWIITPDATALVMIELPCPVLGLAWGGDDPHLLYVAAQSGLYRIRMKIPGPG